MKVEPRPTSDSAVIVPPWSSTSDFEIAGYVTKPIDFELLLGEIDALTRVA